MEKEYIQDSNNIIKFVFSKTIFDLNLIKHDSIKELLNYINGKDVELMKVKILIKKANKEMRIGNNNKRLFIRKTFSSDKEDKSIICVTTK